MGYEFKTGLVTYGPVWLFFYERKARSKLNIVRKILPKKAVPNPETVKPRTSFDASINKRALITSKNSPKEISVSGKVKNTRIGRNMAFKNPRISADTINEDLLEKRMPSKM
jgi:hypothetical protein